MKQTEGQKNHEMEDKKVKSDHLQLRKHFSVFFFPV